jgi:Domain of unknown function (DUF4394)/PEP-CTERM motif
MKSTCKRKDFNTRIGGCLWGLCGLMFVGVRANAAHELMYAVEEYGNLISFYSDAPQIIRSAIPITGLQSGETLRGIDMGANGLLYALGSSSRLYTINPNTGALSGVGGQFSTLLNGITFGMDIGPTGVCVTSDLGQSLLINTTTGAATVQASPAYAAGDPHFGLTATIDALAYNPASGTWIAGDSGFNSFASFTPSTGSLSTIGPAGFDFSRFNGLDFSQVSGILYFASWDDDKGDPAANLYAVSPTTGKATLIGLIGNPGDNYVALGLTVAQIPEPSSLGLLALGGVLFTLRSSSNMKKIHALVSIASEFASAALWATPHPVGVGPARTHFPRVARSSQPWAGGGTIPLGLRQVAEEP